MRSASWKRGALFFLVASLACGRSLWAQCSAVVDSGPAWLHGAVVKGASTLSIYVDSHGTPISKEFQTALQNAIEKWKATNDQGQLVGQCTASPSIPEFKVEFGARDAQTAPPGVDDIREIAIALDYRPDVEPSFDPDEGTLALATYDRNSNTISVFGKCPNPPGGIPCDATGHVDWVAGQVRYGERVLAHEIGHALHLFHDTCTGSVMLEQADLGGTGGAVLQTHCDTADEVNDGSDFYILDATFSCVTAAEYVIVSINATLPDGNPYGGSISGRGSGPKRDSHPYEGGTQFTASAAIVGNPAKSCTVTPSSGTINGPTTLSVACSCNGSTSSPIYGQSLFGAAGTCDQSCSVPDDPLDNLRDHCTIAAATCYGTDPNGGSGVPHYFTTCWRVTQYITGKVQGANGQFYDVVTVIETTQCKDGFVVYSTPSPTDLSAALGFKNLGQTTGTGPITAVMEPGANEVLSGTVELSGLARDDTYGTAQVALWIDNEPAPVQNLTWGEPMPGGCIDLPNAPASGCNPNMGWSATLDTTLLTNGSHKLQVVAVSGRGDQWPPVTYRETAFQVENCLDAISPTATLDSPLAGASVTGPVAVTGTFADDVGVTRVDLLVDGVQVAHDSTAPFGFTWDSSTVGIGDHTLELRARDACDNRGRSGPVTVSVWNPIPGGPAIRVEKAFGNLARLSQGETVVYPDVAEGATISRLFTITNDGDAPLTLSNPSGLVSGTCWQQISPFPTTPIASGGSTSFRVRLQCTDYGLKTGTVTIASNDGDDPAFQFNVQGTVGAPDIRVTQAVSGTAVSPGATVQIGTTDEGVSISLQFAIHNDGNQDLVLSNALSLVSGTCFQQIENPAATVGAGGITYFRVRLLCNTAGSYTGTVSISSNDSDESPYAFSVKGTVTAPPPDIRVAQTWDGVTVVPGSTQQFPTIVAGSTDSRRYVIYNDGAGTLTLTNRTTLVFGSCFQQIETPTSSVAPGGFTYFRVRISCGSAGTFTGTVSIGSNDPDENPYAFYVRGTVLAPPDIRVTHAWDGALQGLGSTITFPTVQVGSSVSRRFAIYNDGGTTLYLSNPSALVSGTCFQQIETPTSTVAPGGIAYFRVRLFCNSGGSYLGTVSISSNDPDENPYWFRVSGTVDEPPPDIAVTRAWDGVAIGNGGSFTFPSVAAGGSVSRRFAITNSGIGSLNITNATSLVSGTCFQQIETPTTPVAPGGTAYVRVRVLCNTAGSYTGYLTIYSNDPDENPYRITLYGTVTQ